MTKENPNYNPNSIETEFCSSFCSKFNSKYCKDECQSYLIANLIDRLNKENSYFIKEIEKLIDNHKKHTNRLNEIINKTMIRLALMKGTKITK